MASRTSHTRISKTRQQTQSELNPRMHTDGETNKESNEFNEERAMHTEF